MLKDQNAKAMLAWLVGAALLTAGSALAGEKVTVTGEARIERRSTIVPLMICDDGESRCPKPETYWVIVLEQGGETYETRQRFHVGDEKSPESVELKVADQDVTLRQGSRITVEAEADRIADHYFMLGDLTRIDFVMDRVPMDARFATDDSLVWTCRTVADLPRPLRVDVFKGIGKALDNYSLALLAEPGRGEKPLVESDRPQIDRSPETLTFAASSDDAAMQLVLDQRSQSVDDVRGRLQVWGDRHGSPIEILSDVRCQRRWDR